jgi:hypothetical protein
MKCGKTPKEGWYYMPSTGDNVDYFYCDDCVPRGCSCNQDLKEGIDYESEEAKKPENWIDMVDDKGRKLPCCEYFWVDNKHDYEQRFSLDNPNHPDKVKE